MTAERPGLDSLRVGDAPWQRMVERIDAMPDGPERRQARIDLNAILTAYNAALREALAAVPVDRDGLREALDGAARALIVAFRRWHIDRHGYAPTVHDFRLMLDMATDAALSAPEPKDRP